MKRKLLLMLLCAALGLGAAQAEVYRVESEADVPADWAEKDTLRLTCIDTNRSDAMVLQSGGEAMMVDSGEGRYRKRVYATLDGYGITELKYLLNTHCDDDHLHGFIYLMYSDLYQVDAFLSPNTTTYVDEEGYHQQAVKATGTKNIPYVQIGDGDEEHPLCADWRRRRIDAGQREADDFPLPPADGAEQPQCRLHGAVRGFAGVPDRRY